MAASNLPELLGRHQEACSLPNAEMKAAFRGCLPTRYSMPWGFSAITGSDGLIQSSLIKPGCHRPGCGQVLLLPTV